MGGNFTYELFIDVEIFINIFTVTKCSFRMAFKIILNRCVYANYPYVDWKRLKNKTKLDFSNCPYSTICQ